MTKAIAYVCGIGLFSYFTYVYFFMMDNILMTL